MIDAVFQMTLLLAQTEPAEIPVWGSRAQEVFKGWQNTNQVFPVRTLGFLLFCVLVVLTTLWVRQWIKDRPKDPTAYAIFRKLARDLNLSLRDQWLLSRISRNQQLPSPITLMLSRQTYDHHAQAYIAQLVDIRRPGVGQRVQSIESRLFGTREQAQADLLAVLAAAKFKLPTAEELAKAGVGAANITQSIPSEGATSAPAQPTVG
jgi:hypothetical protein